MNFVKGVLVLLMISRVLVATGANPRGTAQAQAADHRTVITVLGRRPEKRRKRRSLERFRRDQRT